MTNATTDVEPLATGTMTPETMTLENIESDWDLRVRAIDPKHVNDLLGSILAQGLLEPLVVDKDGVLIAGNHRYAAVVQLKEGHPDEFRRWFPRSQVPVNRLPYRASEHMEEAIAASVAENQKRQDLDARSVKEYRDKLAKKFKLHVGRPKDGETAVMAMLAMAFQRSPRYLRKAIAKAEGKGMGSYKAGPGGLLSPEPIPASLYLPEGVTVAAFEAMKPLERAKQYLVAQELTEAEFQALSEWCLLSRRERNATVGKGGRRKA